MFKAISKLLRTHHVHEVRHSLAVDVEDRSLLLILAAAAGMVATGMAYRYIFGGPSAAAAAQSAAASHSSAAATAATAATASEAAAAASAASATAAAAASAAFAATASAAADRAIFAVPQHGGA